MAELKTKPTKASVDAFLKRIEDDDRRKDCQTDCPDHEEGRQGRAEDVGPDASSASAADRYKYASGREADWLLVGFAPRKADLTLYIMGGLDRFPAILARLGKYKTAKSCLYIKRLADVDRAVLEELVSASVKYLKEAHT